MNSLIQKLSLVIASAIYLVFSLVLVFLFNTAVYEINLIELSLGISAISVALSLKSVPFKKNYILYLAVTSALISLALSIYLRVADTNLNITRSSISFILVSVLLLLIEAYQVGSAIYLTFKDMKEKTDREDNKLFMVAVFAQIAVSLIAILDCWLAPSEIYYYLIILFVTSLEVVASNMFKKGMWIRFIAGFNAAVSLIFAISLIVNEYSHGISSGFSTFLLIVLIFAGILSLVLIPAIYINYSKLEEEKIIERYKES